MDDLLSQPVQFLIALFYSTKFIDEFQMQLMGENNKYFGYTGREIHMQGGHCLQRGFIGALLFLLTYNRESE